MMVLVNVCVLREMMVLVNVCVLREMMVLVNVCDEMVFVTT